LKWTWKRDPKNRSRNSRLGAHAWCLRLRCKRLKRDGILEQASIIGELGAVLLGMVENVQLCCCAVVVATNTGYVVDCGVHARQSTLVAVMRAALSACSTF
jgi:hypothetical protein